jgi:hypothetical protein
MMLFTSFMLCEEKGFSNDDLLERDNG